MEHDLKNDQGRVQGRRPHVKEQAHGQVHHLKEVRLGNAVRRGNKNKLKLTIWILFLAE
jgi:hypothetical protein